MNEPTETIQLNPAQQAAVEHLHGPLLVIAGAGTGKTRVITERILYLLEAIPGLKGENILAVTYTRKAAGEMTSRIRRRGGQRAAQVEVHTFHDFCYQLLKNHSEALKLLDDIDYWIFLRRRLPRLELDIFKKLSEPGHFLSDFKAFFSRCQDELVSPEDYSGYVAGLAAEFEKEKTLLAEEERARRETEVREQQEISRAYTIAEELLRQANRTTFGGSLLSAVHLLENNPDLLAHYQNRLRYIVVDEFQDTNIAQVRLLELLARRHRNIMVVGDDDQAIYRFRGASYASFRRFDDLYPDGKKITLSQNYRSTAPILTIAGELIAQNGPARFDPDKKLTPAHPGGEKVRLAEIDDAAAEARYVRQEIARQQKAAGSYGGIAVLYRAHTQRNALIEELSRVGIPFVIRGLSILSSTLVRDLIAYLRAIHSPKDNISLTRLLAIPAWKLTPALLRDLIALARREKYSLHNAAESLHEDVRNQQTGLGKLLELLAALRPQAREAPLTKLFDTLADHIGLKLLPHDPDRVYLESFLGFLRQWEAEKSETKRLAEFIEYLDYFEEARGSVNLPEEAGHPDAVHLMTVHSAKGLEFDTVFVLRLNRSDFPTKRRQPLFEFPEALMQEALPPGDFHIQEERRLCYVAFTRARQRLLLSTLTGPRKKPSVFLEDILRHPTSAARIQQTEPQTEPQPDPAGAAPTIPTTGQAALFGRAKDAAFYSRITAWAQDNDGLEIADPLPLNHSALRTFKDCPLKYKLENLWQLRGFSNPAMVFGSIMHRTLAEFFRARQKNPGLPREELKHLYDLQWEAAVWPFPDQHQHRDYRASGWEQLKIFYAQQAGQTVTVLDMEKNFEWKWEDVVLTGRIDQINQLDGRTVELVEYKTGKPQTEKQVEKSPQLALYALAAERELRYQPQRLTLYNLTSNQPHSFSPEEKTLNQVLEDIRATAARIRARAFPATPNYFCRTCDYRTLCPAQEQNLSMGLPGNQEE